MFNLKMNKSGNNLEYEIITLGKTGKINLYQIERLMIKQLTLNSSNVA